MKTYLRIIFFLAACLLLQNCDKDDSALIVNNYEVLLKNTDEYTFDTNISGDEEGASIKTQALNYCVSELIRNADTNWSVIYQYKSKEGYVGNDRVEIEVRKADIESALTTKEIIKINFVITD